MGECSSKLTFVKAISQVAPECKTDEHGVHQVSLGPLGTFQTVLSDVFFNILVGIMILYAIQQTSLNRLELQAQKESRKVRMKRAGAVRVFTLPTAALPFVTLALFIPSTAC